MSSSTLPHIPLMDELEPTDQIAVIVKALSTRHNPSKGSGLKNQIMPEDRRLDMLLKGLSSAQRAFPGGPGVVVCPGVAVYNRRDDILVIAPKEDFTHPSLFYHAFLHELAHSTAYPGRVDREISTAHAKPLNMEYCYEEIVAELTSAEMCRVFCVDYGAFSPHDIHTAYVQEYAQAILEKRQPYIQAEVLSRMLPHAISDARRASAFLVEHMTIPS